MADLLDKTQTTSVDQVTGAVYAVINRTTTPADRWITPGDFFKSRTGNDTVLSYASLSAAITAIGVTQATIEIPATTTVSASLTIPSNITLEIIGAGLISVSVSQTLTINGPIAAPQRQIFTGSGTVVIGFETVSPRWFGALGDCKIVSDASVSGTALTSATATFVAADTGKKFDVAGVGAATTLSAVIIAFTDSTHVELSIKASYTGSSKTISLDAATIATGSMTAGDETLTAGSAFFTADDVGKLVRVTDVGAKNISGTLTFVNSTTCTMSVSASATLSSRRLIYGTDDHAAIAKAIAALPNGGEIHSPKGLYVNGSALTISTSNLKITGAGKNATIIYSVGPIHSSSGSMFNSINISNGCSEIDFADISINGTNWTAQSPTFSADCDGVNIGSSGPINNIKATRCAFSYHWSIGFHCGGSATLVFGSVTSVTNISLIDVECAFCAYDGANPNPAHGLIILGGAYHHNGSGGIECSTSSSIVDTHAYHNFQGGVSVGGYGGSDMGTGVLVRGVYHFNGIYGVVLGSNMRHCQIIGVQASDNGYQGILVDGTGGASTNGYHLIEGCTANNNPNSNIIIGGDADFCVVRGCKGTGAGSAFGLSLSFCDSTEVEGNTFLGNTVDYTFQGATNTAFSCTTPGSTFSEAASPTFKALRGMSGAADGYVVTTFSATPTFDAAKGNTFKITLTANVTSATVSNGVSGQLITLIIVQDPASARTFVYPTNMFGGTTIGTTLSKSNVQSFRFDGTNWFAVAAGVINQG